VMLLVADHALPGAVPGRPTAFTAVGFILRPVAHGTVEMFSPVGLTQFAEAFMVEFLVVVETCNWDLDGAVVGTGPPMGGPLCQLFLTLGLSLFVKQHCEGQYRYQ
jgi:hypothetical protein